MLCRDLAPAWNQSEKFVAGGSVAPFEALVRAVADAFGKVLPVMFGSSPDMSVSPVGFRVMLPPTDECRVRGR